MIRQATSDAQIEIEDIQDPSEIARCRSQDHRARRNSEWLQANWATLLPGAQGKFIAVAGREGFVAATAEEAWRMARAAHPEDDGAISQYVFQVGGPRIYAHRG